MEKKRLLKDLPFDALKKGDVLTKAVDGYYIDCGRTFYSGGGDSSNGCNYMTENAAPIIDLIWNDPKWFVQADIKHVDIKATKDKIIISFDPVDLEQSQIFAMGIRSCLSKFASEDGSHTWDEFKGFTMSLS